MDTQQTPRSVAVTIERVSFGHPDVVRLVADLQQEFVLRYGGPDETVLGVDTFDDESGQFFLGHADGAAGRHRGLAAAA